MNDMIIPIENFLICGTMSLKMFRIYYGISGKSLKAADTDGYASVASVNFLILKNFHAKSWL